LIYGNKKNTQKNLNLSHNNFEILKLHGYNSHAHPIILLHGTASSSVGLFDPILDMLRDND